MKWPLVTRARYEAAHAEIAGLRQRVLNTEDRHDEVEEERRSLARQYAALEELYAATSLVNSRLTEELTAAREQLASSDDGWQAKYEAEKKRADRLQQRLDDALGLNTHAIAAGSTWRDRRTDKKGNQ